MEEVEGWQHPGLVLELEEEQLGSDEGVVALESGLVEERECWLSVPVGSCSMTEWRTFCVLRLAKAELVPRILLLIVGNHGWRAEL